MKRFLYILIVFVAIGWGCDDEEFLNREPQNILLEDQVWTDDDVALSVLADLYFRLPELQGITNWDSFLNFFDFDEAFISNAGDYGLHKRNNYSYDEWGLWDYGLMREINLFIEKAREADGDELSEKDRFIAEGRFLRAWVYFEMVKRMGGVPLITEPLEYDFSGDPSYLQHPRAEEHEVYDFILEELDEIQADLPDDVDTKARATRGLMLAMKSRVALYAASIAKYGENTPSVSTSGGEVGIDPSMADDYYQQALDAAETLISDGAYSLYDVEDDPSENFANIFVDKNNNPEVIFVRDFMESEDWEDWTNKFTLWNQPWSLAEDIEGGRLNPSLNLAQRFELLDNTFEPFRTKDENGDWIFYDEPGDIFDNRDARLEGTIIVPGSEFKEQPVDIWAGYMLADGTTITGDGFGDEDDVPGLGNVQIVGDDGPIDGREFSAQTGFYIRKHMDPDKGSGQRGLKSNKWWVRYRLGEVYLNAAEAAFELGDPETAADYMNEVRRRAGFTEDLEAADITFDRIVHERRVELAFEGHQLWDYKRWRIAHEVFDGQQLEVDDLTEDPSDVLASGSRVFGLWPYKYHDPDDPDNPNNGKWVFEEIRPSEVTGAYRFRMGNYYSRIGDDILNNNPEIVKNPNHN
ncbi:MAG: RagB/SusD family nutrient uptake outer membrane protein [Marinilabilia sp.]